MNRSSLSMNLCFILFVVYIFSFLPPLIAETPLAQGTRFETTPLFEPIIMSSDTPISIVSDQNFTDYAFPGVGTAEDPFRIEDFSINTTKERAISVEFTSKYFIIRNCTISSSRYGIFINSVTTNTAIISNNTCINCWTGINVEISASIIVENNFCNFNENYGIRVHGSDFAYITENICNNNFDGLNVHQSNQAVITNNKCENNKFVGLIIWDLDANNVTNNLCKGNKYGLETRLFRGLIEKNICLSNQDSGISVTGSSNSVISNNTCLENQFGIYQIDSLWTTIEDNKCVSNNFGIFLSFRSWYGVLANNTCANNSNYGIHLEKTKQCVLSSNILRYNIGYGMYLEESVNDSVIFLNLFISNYIGGNSQAYDDGVNNIWYDRENKVGNYWSDLKGKRKYRIDGKSESVDKYPLDENLERISFPLLILPIAFSLVSLYYKKNKRR